MKYNPEKYLIGQSVTLSYTRPSPIDGAKDKIVKEVYQINPKHRNKTPKKSQWKISNEAEVNLIHHSDRGCQYASREYVNTLQEHGIRISMTESGDPKDNAQAERINNTMKNELLKGMTLGSIQEVIGAVAVAVDFYNNRRPHMSLGMKTPAEMAESIGDRDMKWKSWRLEAIKTRNNANIPENCLPLSTSQGPPSGLRPSVNP